MILWLDDFRNPAAHGYIFARWAKTYEEAIQLLQIGEITFASLDHDLGACPDCTEKMLHIGDMLTPETTFFNHCPHEKSGHDVVCWMEENNIWPIDGCKIHSMNPVGRDRMNQVIEKHYGRTF